MIKFLRKWDENFSVERAAILVAVFSLLSRAVGLLRDRLFAGNFGAGDTLDAYYAAFRIPDFIFNLLILGTLSAAFIPVFTEKFLQNKEDANRLACSIFNTTLIGMAAVCLILAIFIEPLTRALVPGFEPQKLAETIALSRIFLVSPIIFSASNILSGILNAQKKFFIVSLAPVLYNLGIIFGLLYLYPSFGIRGLGYGVVLGAVLHFLVQLIESVRLGFVWKPAIDFKNPDFAKIIRLFLPRIFGMDNSQVSLLIGSIVGSFLVSGSIAVFNLANNLQAVPLGIFAVSLSVAAFPLLSEQYAQKKEKEFGLTLAATARQILFFIVPFSILMVLFRAQIVRLVLGSGQFDWQDTIMTLQVFGIMSLSLFAQGLSPLFSRAFYARQNTLKPVIFNLVAIFTNALLAYAFGKTYGIVGVALAFSFAAILNCVLLYAFLRKLVGFKILDGILFTGSIKILIASFFMGLAAYGSLYAMEVFVNTRTFAGLLIQTSVSAGLAVITYLFFASRLRLETASYLLNKFKF